MDSWIRVDRYKCVDYVCYFYMFVGWEAGVYMSMEVHSLWTLYVDFWVWVEKAVNRSMGVFKLRT